MLLLAETEEGLYGEDVTYVDPMGTHMYPSGTSMVWARAPSLTRPGQIIRVFMAPIGGS